MNRIKYSPTPRVGNKGTRFAVGDINDQVLVANVDFSETQAGLRVGRDPPVVSIDKLFVSHESKVDVKRSYGSDQLEKVLLSVCSYGTIDVGNRC